uniref:Uncharacterized protein n=1 Tax=Vespula pensylvanica TaxID=30213 RepID=A0A834JVN8_VESPE|nr:hypothetical protein H0235_017061 [Vespula pensylvanica]
MRLRAFLTLICCVQFYGTELAPNGIPDDVRKPIKRHLPLLSTNGNAAVYLCFGDEDWLTGTRRWNPLLLLVD